MTVIRSLLLSTPIGETLRNRSHFIYLLCVQNGIALGLCQR